MLHVILLILKVIGLILLAVLALVLLALLLALFCPVRYRADASFDGEPRGTAAVSWLFGALRVILTYDGAAKLTAKALWFSLFQTRLWPEEETSEEAEAAKEQEVTRPEITQPEVWPKPTSEQHPDEDFEVQATSLDRGDGRPEEIRENSRTADAGQEERGTCEARAGTGRVSQEKTSEKGGTENTGFAEKAGRRIQAAFARFGTKAQETFQKLLSALKRLSSGFKAGQARYEKAMAFLQDEENKKTIALLFTQTKKLFFHLFPRKIKGRIRFGFEDPYYTGKVLTAVSPFYGLYAKSLSLEPVFGEKALEGELHIRGRVRAATLLWIGVRVLLNKNFRTLLRKWRK